jgi:phosphoribosylamine--glycine ligase
MEWDKESGSFYSDGTRVAYMNANIAVEEGTSEVMMKASEQLRNRILSAFDNDKLRVIPRENKEGNRLDIRRDIGSHYSIAHLIFG